MSRTRPPLPLLIALFLVSGAAALIVETTWMRWFRLLLGATAPATSATLVAFLVGNALGAVGAARLLARARRPLALYGGLEWAAAAWAVAVPLLLALGEAGITSAYDGLRGSPAALTLLRLAVALAATLPTSVCLGATLPAMAAAAMHDARALGTRGNALYGANLLGAAAGAALAAFWLPVWLGVGGTYAVAIGLQIAVGAVALLVARDATPRAGPGVTGDASPLATRLYLLAALSGFGSFAAQVLLVNAFAQVLNQSIYAFGAVLVTVLGSLAIGAAATTAFVHRRPCSLEAALVGATALCALASACFPALLHAATGGLRYLGSGRPWPGYLVEALFWAALVAGPLLLSAALVFPLCVALAAEGRAPGSGSGAGARLGRLAAANTLGAIGGALAASYLLLPTLGPWASFLALAALYALPVFGAWRDRGLPRRTRIPLFAAGSAAVLWLASPLAHPTSRLAAGERLLHQQSSAAGVVSVVERAGERLIRTDNHYALGGSADKVHEERQGHLPLLLHPAPRRVAFVGTATGITAGAALAHPVERLVLVEIAPDVANAARHFFAESNRGVYSDPRAEAVVDDARNFFRATRERFDVIVADLFVPWRSGTGSLYTREHFTALRDRLLEGGLLCQWLPLYQLGRAELESIAASFVDVFPNATLYRGDFYGGFPIVALCGWQGAPAASFGAQADAARRLAAAGERDRWVTDPLGLWSLRVAAMEPWVREREIARNTDDRPLIEFLAARGHAGGTRGKLDPLVGLTWVQTEQEIRDAARRAGAEPPGDLPAEARRASDAGTALQLAGALYVAGRIEEASRALASASEGLPRHLLAEGEPDPSAAELWWDER